MWRAPGSTCLFPIPTVSRHPRSAAFARIWVRISCSQARTSPPGRKAADACGWICASKTRATARGFGAPPSRGPKLICPRWWRAPEWTCGQSRAEAQAAAPPTSDVARLYAEGLTHLRQFDAKGARELLERAVATAPEYALAHSALSAAWSALGYSEMARQEARRALDLAKGLPRAQQLSIEARLDESAGQWDKAVAIYRKLGDLFPDDPDYGLRCAAAQVKAGRGKDALATVEMLRAKPAAVRDDAAIDYAQSLAANQTGDFLQAQEAAARAAAKAGEREEGMLVADARLLECRELEALGRMAQAQKSCGTAKSLYDFW